MLYHLAIDGRIVNRETAEWQCRRLDLLAQARPLERSFETYKDEQSQPMLSSRDETETWRQTADDVRNGISPQEDRRRSKAQKLKKHGG